MATYYVDTTTGDNADNGTTEALAWATLAYAFTQMAAGDHLYVKGGVDYDENGLAPTPGAGTTPTIIEGYTTTPGDGGFFTIAPSVGSYGISSNVAHHTVYKNMIITGTGNNGVNMSGADYVVFYNCKILNSGAAGVHVDNYCAFINCEISGSTSHGLWMDDYGCVVGCKIYSNGGTGLRMLAYNTACYKNVIYNNSGNQLAMDSANTNHVIACTIDGDNAAVAGIGSNSMNYGILLDNIIYDCGTGVSSTTPTVHNRRIGANCLLNSNTTDHANTTSGNESLAELSSAPSFTDEAGDDYTLQHASAAVGAGIKPGALA